jgi:hypothetical protein
MRTEIDKEILMAQLTSSTKAAETQSTFRIVQWLLSGYAIVGWLGFLSAILLTILASTKNNPDLVNTTTWIHGMIVALTGIPFIKLVDKAANAKGRAVARLRIVLTVVPIAFIAVIFFLPLPLWMDIEQVVCATLLLAAAVAYFGRK